MNGMDRTMHSQSNPFLSESAVLSQFPGFGPTRARQLAGYLSVGDDGGGWLYFWFSEAAIAPESAPLIIWINHAPEQNALGCLFDGHGPYLLGDGGRVHANPFSWHQHAHYLIIDQPLGHGLSFAIHPRYQPENHAEGSQQVYLALQEFFLRWPRYRQQACYLFGLGQACHTIAHLARRILDGNQCGQPQIHLLGLGLGNAWLAPEIQLQSEIEFAAQHRLIRGDELGKAQALLQDFRQVLASTSPLRQQRSTRLALELEAYLERCSGRDARDIRQPPRRAASRLADFLDKPGTRQALHIDPRAQASAAPWPQSSWLESPSALFPPLLEKLNILFFHGEYGMLGNHLGLDVWLNTLLWSQAEAFRQQKPTEWRPYGLPAGTIRRLSGLSHVLIHNSGQHIARDQPANALAMLRQYLQTKEAIAYPAPYII